MTCKYNDLWPEWVIVINILNWAIPQTLITEGWGQVSDMFFLGLTKNVLVL